MRPTPSTETAMPPRSEFHIIALEKIRHSTVQPRRYIDPIRQAELVASVREKGVETPIGVRPVHDGLFEVVRGERRTRAAETVGLTEIPCMVRAMTDAEALESALVENVQRQDMNVMEEAQGYADLQKADKRIYTVEHLARVTGLHKSHIYKLLRLVTLEKEFTAALREHRLTLGHAERLLRLTPAQRESAMEEDLVWRRSPLFDDRKKWVPSKDELQPVSQLDAFIRRYADFDPNAEDLQHFLPDVAAAREEAIDEEIENGPDTQHSDPIDPPTLLKLSNDSLVRIKLGHEQGNKATPLSPSKWKQVKPGSCEHAQLGAVVHGGPPRVLTVCIKRSCAKHWPQPKKKPAAKKGDPEKAAAPKESSWERDNRLQKEARDEWAPLWPRVREAFIEHLEKAKPRLTVAFFRAIFAHSEIDDYAIKSVEQQFGIAFKDNTIALVFALITAVGCDTRKDFLEVAKIWKFNMGPTEQALKRELAAKSATTAKKGKAA